MTDCASRDLNVEKLSCKSKKDYYKNAFLLHPDRNDGCQEEATTKFQLYEVKCEMPGNYKALTFTTREEGLRHYYEKDIQWDISRLIQKYHNETLENNYLGFTKFVPIEYENEFLSLLKERMSIPNLTIVPIRTDGAVRFDFYIEGIPNPTNIYEEEPMDIDEEPMDIEEQPMDIEEQSMDKIISENVNEEFIYRFIKMFGSRVDRYPYKNGSIVYTVELGKISIKEVNKIQRLLNKTHREIWFHPRAEVVMDKRKNGKFYIQFIYRKLNYY